MASPQAVAAAETPQVRRQYAFGKEIQPLSWFWPMPALGRSTEVTTVQVEMRATRRYRLPVVAPPIKDSLRRLTQARRNTFMCSAEKVQTPKRQPPPKPQRGMMEVKHLCLHVVCFPLIYMTLNPQAVPPLREKGALQWSNTRLPKLSWRQL